ncbi:MAG: 50S ribosomal protein L3 [Acidobacteria bacterium]|nr:50S ribosomal protein L3 [Acidobacteriota bacterium]
MVTGIIGQKIGMTQVFGTDGAARPVTVLKAGPCVVIQRKQADRDGYEAVQLGLVEDRPARVTKPVAGLYARANVPPTRVRREVPLDGGSDAPAEGERVLASLFAEGEQVDVTGISRGHGFQGVMKRHGFGGGRATHGSMFHRAPGSIGQSSYPSRVLKGMRAPGRMGGDQVTVRNLRVVTVDAESNRLVVTGAVPGAAGAYVVIRRAVAPRREPAAPPVDEKKKKKR